MPKRCQHKIFRNKNLVFLKTVTFWQQCQLILHDFPTSVTVQMQCYSSDVWVCPRMSDVPQQSSRRRRCSVTVQISWNLQKDSGSIQTSKWWGNWNPLKLNNFDDFSKGYPFEIGTITTFWTAFGAFSFANRVICHPFCFRTSKRLLQRANDKIIRKNITF